jgi:hydrogenase maturation protein HypF
MGRLFDAVAAACFLAPECVSFEGQAAMLLEAAITPGALEAARETSYPLSFFTDGDLLCLDPRPLWRPLLDDLHAGLDQSAVSARFHMGLAKALCSWVSEAYRRIRPVSRKVVLCGGVFQNPTLLERLMMQLQGYGYEPLSAVQLPSNDGGLAYGQALVSAAHALSDR